MAARINALAGEEVALPYHGSLSRERRLMLEQSLKAGALRALVSTSSLGAGDRHRLRRSRAAAPVAEARRQRTAARRPRRTFARRGEPRRVRADLPRRRAWRCSPSFARCATATSSRRASSRTRSTSSRRSSSPSSSIDDDWTSAALFDLVRRAYPYHALTRAAFDEVLAMLVGQVSVRRRRGARRAAELGSRHRHAHARRAARAWSPSSPAARSPIADSTPSISPTARGSASSTRSSCTRRASATSSSSARRPGASTRSSTIA